MGLARQGDLFAQSPLEQTWGCAQQPQLPLLAEQLQQWQLRLAAHQGPLFRGEAPLSQQQSLLGSALASYSDAEQFNPLALQPQPLTFWRWPQAPVCGAALYVVLDRPAGLEQPLLLYVGETARAEQRWKGEHDCKAYLAAYGDALQKAGLSTRLSIGFWSDVPQQTRPRRALEQALIRRWLPPFNKETRSRWATPFQAEPT